MASPPRPHLSLSVSPDFLSVRSDSSWLALSRKLTATRLVAQRRHWPLACCRLRGVTHTQKAPPLFLCGWLGHQHAGLGGLARPTATKGTNINSRVCRKYQCRTAAPRREPIVIWRWTTVQIRFGGRGWGVGAAMWLMGNYEFNCWDAAAVVVWGVLLLPSVSSWSGWKENVKQNPQEPLWLRFV